MKKFICSFIILIIVLIFSDFILYLSGMNRYIKERKLEKAPYSWFNPYNEIYNSKIPIDLYGYSNLKDSECKGKDNCQRKIRYPDGIQYSKPPVILFGCSYTHGQNLLQNQTFSYKLSEQLKRPVYNRGIIGGGLALMYYQTLNNYFYETVPPSDTVIYVMINDQYRRMLSHKFDPVEASFYINYKYDKKTKSLKLNVHNNKILNMIEMSYLYSFIKAKYISYLVKNPKFSERLTDLAVLYFIKSREELEKHWNKKINFIVILYDDDKIDFAELLTEKLIANGFKVIKASDLGEYNLYEEKYKLPDNHPNEYVWDELTPLIIKKADL